MKNLSVLHWRTLYQLKIFIFLYFESANQFHLILLFSSRQNCHSNPFQLFKVLNARFPNFHGRIRFETSIVLRSALLAFLCPRINVSFAQSLKYLECATMFLIVNSGTSYSTKSLSFLACSLRRWALTMEVIHSLILYLVQTRRKM